MIRRYVLIEAKDRFTTQFYNGLLQKNLGCPSADLTAVAETIRYRKSCDCCIHALVKVYIQG